MTKFSVAAINHVTANSASQNDIKSAIVKNNISDHFIIRFWIISKAKSKTKDE